MVRETEMITTSCGNCKREIIMPKRKYNDKIKRSTRGMVFCSTACSSTKPESKIELKCSNPKCGKTFIRQKWIYDMVSEENKGRGYFCSRECALIGRPITQETKMRISESQKGISVPSRGVIGHEVSEEVRQKISETKSGLSIRSSWDLVTKELKHKGISKHAIMSAPIPDAVWIEDRKLVALEVERERWEAGIRTKMQEYVNHYTKWDKVYLVWYNLEGKRMKEWILENGEWRTVVAYDGENKPVLIGGFIK